MTDEENGGNEAYAYNAVYFNRKKMITIITTAIHKATNKAT